MTTVPRRPSYDGPTLFSYGFRPFFLLGSIYAGLAILAWLPVFMGELSLTTTLSPRDWHVHEMLYGFLPAAMTGFLLTAIPNWTGRLPLRGPPLMFLVALWAAGRACVTFSAQTGWLAASRDELCQGLDWLEDSMHNQATGQAASSWIKELIGSWDDCAGRYAAAYTDLLERRA